MLTNKLFSPKILYKHSSLQVWRLIMNANNSPSYDEFFAKVKEKISDERCRNFIEASYKMAKEAPRRQVRDDGERYFEHVKAVAWICLTETTITDQLRLTIIVCGSLFHDMLEDTYMSKVRHLKIMFDHFHPEITKVAHELTKVPKKRQPDILKRLARMLSSNSTPTKIVKLADRLHNLRTLLHCRHDKAIRKIHETRDIILPWARDHSKLDKTTNMHPNHRTMFKREINGLADKVEQELIAVEKELSALPVP